MDHDFTAPGVPPAWHPDPQDSSRQRWWDGTEWTENVRAANMLPAISNPNLIGETVPPEPDSVQNTPLPAPEAVRSATDDPFATARDSNPFPSTAMTAPPGIGAFQSSAPVSTWDSPAPLAEPLAEPSGYVPMSRMGTPTVVRQGAVAVSTGSGFTPALALMAILPLVHGAIAYFVLNAVNGDDPGALTSPESAAIVLLPLILYPLCALWDANTLSRRGRPRPPLAIVALVPPLYFLFRAFRAAGSSFLMLLLWTVIESVVVGVLLTQMSFTVFDLQFSLQPVPTTSATIDAAVPADEFEAPFTPEKREFILTPEGMAQKLMHDYGVAGVLVNDLVCQPLASTEPSSQTFCNGTLLGVDLVVTVVVGSDTDESVSPVFIAG